jgi:alanine-synthesizing transaminase
MKPVNPTNVRASDGLANVRYEIRGKLARRALELERMGYDIVSLNIGNPYAFGFRTPETMRLAMIENLRHSEGYVHQKGIFPAREAVVMQQQERGVKGVTAEEVFIGNGVSELIDLSLRALLNPGDEVLVPSPDYPLWTAAVNLNTGKAVHYPCRRARLRARPGGNRSAHHGARAPSWSSIPTIPPARCIRANAGGHRAHRGEASPGGAVR